MMTKLMKKFEDDVSAAPRMSGVLEGAARTSLILLKILPPCHAGRMTPQTAAINDRLRIECRASLFQTFTQDQVLNR